MIVYSVFIFLRCLTTSCRLPVEFERPLIFGLFGALDVVEFDQRTFKFLIEEPHCIKNFAKSRSFLCPVSFPEGKNTIVSQISHDPPVGDCIVGQVARLKSSLSRRWDNLDEFEEFHLVDRIYESLADRCYLQEKIRLCVHESISYSGPVIEPMI